MENKNELDLEQIKRQFLKAFRSGKPTFGKDGALGPLLKHFLEAALDAEMDLHLSDEQRGQGNRRNGKVSKQVRTSGGVLEVESSRDRSSDFEPQIIRKRETVLAENLEPRILSMYGLDMSLRDISFTWNCNVLLETFFRQPQLGCTTGLHIDKGSGSQGLNASFSCYTTPQCTQRRLVEPLV